jgi:hypothetical protein
MTTSHNSDAKQTPDLPGFRVSGAGEVLGIDRFSGIFNALKIPSHGQSAPIFNALKNFRCPRKQGGTAMQPPK